MKDRAARLLALLVVANCVVASSVSSAELLRTNLAPVIAIIAKLDAPIEALIQGAGGSHVPREGESLRRGEKLVISSGKASLILRNGEIISFHGKAVWPSSDTPPGAETPFLRRLTRILFGQHLAVIHGAGSKATTSVDHRVRLVGIDCRQERPASIALTTQQVLHVYWTAPTGFPRSFELHVLREPSWSANIIEKLPLAPARSLEQGGITLFAASLTNAVSIPKAWVRVNHSVPRGLGWTDSEAMSSPMSEVLHNLVNRDLVYASQGEDRLRLANAFLLEAERPITALQVYLSLLDRRPVLPGLRLALSQFFEEQRFEYLAYWYAREYQRLTNR